MWKLFFKQIEFLDIETTIYDVKKTLDIISNKLNISEENNSEV